MSDRVTNAEVEDVLSSVRRLVSEDSRAGKSGSPSAPKNRPKTERLVLTPALRVTEAPNESTAPASQSVDGESAAQETPDVSLRSLVTDDEPLDVYTTGSLSAAVTNALKTASADDVADDYSDDPYGFDDADGPNEDIKEVSVEMEQRPQSSALYDPAPEPEVTLSPPAETEAVGGDPVDVTTDSQGAEQIPEPENKAAVLSAKIAALETAIGKISDTWEPDDLGQSDYAGTAPQEMAWEDDVEEPAPFQRPVLAPVMRNVKADDADTVPLGAESSDSDVPTDITPVSKGFTSKRAKTSAAKSVETSPETAPEMAKAAEPEAPPVQDETPEVVAEDLVIEDTTGAEPADEELAEPIGLAEDHQFIDEDALRDLVGDIVRSELQGALGERITRNVRKLVRREIHRALAAQELE